MQIGRNVALVEQIRKLSNITVQSLLKAQIEISENSDNLEFADLKDIPEEVIDSITLVDEAAKEFTLESYLKIIPTCVDLKGKILINKTRIPFITILYVYIIYSWER